MQIILASGSPRRRELFSQLGFRFEITVPHIEEKILDGEQPGVFCSRISADKALSVAHKYPDALIISADTVVVVDGEILGKPRDERQAYEFLERLQNKSHDVFTGYTIINKSHQRTNVIRTKVFFLNMSKEEISWYISTGEAMDKTGAYAVQGIGSIFIDRIEGSYTNVIGLPLSDLYYDLKQFGLALHSIEEG